MGSSIQSHQLSSLEIDETFSGDGPGHKVNRNWRLGMPWFIGASSSRSPREKDSGQSPRYYGGLIKAEEALLPDVHGKKKRSFRGARQQAPFGFGPRITSLRSADEESISNFSISEWTPQDSAYGAACPVCGWIPKQMRRMIEFSLICFMVLVFLWMVVTVSSHISNAHKNSVMYNSTDYYSGQMIAANDDYYVEANLTQTYYGGGG